VLPSAIPATDYHTGGEPFRIVADPPVPIPGRTVAERRARAIEDPAVQGLRAVLCSEPRGHADMYGGFLVPPDDQGADLGVLFWHKDGFSTACGHGTIALGVWARSPGACSAPATLTDARPSFPRSPGWRTVSASMCSGSTRTTRSSRDSSCGKDLTREHAAGNEK